MQNARNRFANLALIAAVGIFFIGSFPVDAKPVTQRTDVKRTVRKAVVPPSPPLAIQAPAAGPSSTRSSSDQAVRADAQAMLDYAKNFNMAIQNISPASDALALMNSQATPDILKLSASERTALGNSWVISVGTRTGLARDSFGLMGRRPTVADPDLQRQIDGFTKARGDVVAVLDKFDQSAQRLSSLVIGWTPARNDEVVAALSAERTKSQREMARAFAATNIAIAASLVPEAPSRHVNLMMASMYNALGTTTDLRVGEIDAQQAARLIAQHATDMRLQSPQGRQKVRALQARLRTGLGSPGMGARDRSALQAVIVTVEDYNKAFDRADRISLALDQIALIILKNDEEGLAKIDVIIADIAALELELLDIIRNLSRRLAG